MGTLLKAGICGHFGGGLPPAEGQTVKTVIFSQKLEEIWGSEQVLKLDTYQWRRHSLRLILGSLRLIRKCQNIIMLPSHNGVKVFIPLFLFLNRFYRKKLQYVIIGAWLPEFLEASPRLRAQMKKLDGLYAETQTMADKLNAMGISRVHLLPNFKELKIVEKPDASAFQEPFRLCTFSRVIREKGICEAVSAVRQVNEQLGREVYTLDIWGAVASGFQEDFERLEAGFPAFIRYKGCLSYRDTTDTLKEYFAMLFPTRYRGEGIPGAVLDAYAAGLPVLASRFYAAPEIIDHGVTGLLLDFDHITEALIKTLCGLAREPQVLLSMRIACVCRATDFQADRVVREFADMLEQEEKK